MGVVGLFEAGAVEALAHGVSASGTWHARFAQQRHEVFDRVERFETGPEPVRKMF